MKLDPNLERIIEIAMKANPSETEYYLRRHISDILRHKKVLRDAQDELSSNAFDEPDWYGQDARLQEQIQSVDDLVFKLNMNLSSALCAK